MCLHGPDKKLASRQHDLLILMDLLTGCTVLDKHLETTVTYSDQHVVKRMKQTPSHFANVMMHCHTMEASTIQLEELRKVSTLSLLWFAKASPMF